MNPDEAGRWLVLLHRVPPNPPYLRSKILRRLRQVGAVAIKRSAYVLPAAASCEEDLRWLLRTIREGNGEGWILRGSLVAGLRDDELEQAFREARQVDYEELAEQAQKLLEVIETAGDPRPIRPPQRAEWTRIRKRLAAVRRIDFFSASGAQLVEALMERIEPILETTMDAKPVPTGNRSSLHARVWVTRAGIEEDRMASAWLIGRFVDQAAQFRFLEPTHDAPRSGEIPFDTYGGEFTHRDDRCTFQVLLDHFALKDDALRAIGEIVHEIDLKDDRYGRPETPGLALAIEGIVLRHRRDEDRLRDGCALFDALFESLGMGGHSP